MLNLHLWNVYFITFSAPTKKNAHLFRQPLTFPKLQVPLLIWEDCRSLSIQTGWVLHQSSKGISVFASYRVFFVTLRTFRFSSKNLYFLSLVFVDGFSPDLRKKDLQSVPVESCFWKGDFSSVNFGVKMCKHAIFNFFLLALRSAPLSSTKG